MQKDLRLWMSVSLTAVMAVIAAAFYLVLASPSGQTAVAQSATATPAATRATAAVTPTVAATVAATATRAVTATTATTTTATPTPDPLRGKTVIASNLREPRQMTYGADGTLYIAESGIGGNSSLTVVATRTISTGLTSRITAITPDGKQSVVLEGLPSMPRNINGTDFMGASAIHVTDDSYWITIGQGGPEQRGKAFPLFHYLAEVDRQTNRIKRLVDLWTAAQEAQQPSADDPFSNPTDIAVTEDGTVLIADASANVLWSWTAEDGVKVVAKWAIEDNPVSDSVAVGPDGDIYVGMLTGFPFPVGTARIERWSGGELKQTYEGLTMVTDVLVTDEGDIYAVQFAEFGERGPKPASGKVVQVMDNGIETVMDGLTSPYGLAQNPTDGSIVVSLISTGDREGKGAVIKVK